MTEQIAAETALFDLLVASEGVTDIVDDRVYVGFAPEGAPKPYVLAQQATAVDVACQNTNLLGTRFTYLAEGYSDGESYPHELSQAIHLAIHGVRQEVAIDNANWIVDIARLRPLSMPDQYQGKEIRRSGGMFEVYVRCLLA